MAWRKDSSRKCACSNPYVFAANILQLHLPPNEDKPKYFPLKSIEIRLHKQYANVGDEFKTLSCYVDNNWMGIPSRSMRYCSKDNFTWTSCSSSDLLISCSWDSCLNFRKQNFFSHLLRTRIVFWYCSSSLILLIQVFTAFTIPAPVVQNTSDKPILLILYFRVFSFVLFSSVDPTLPSSINIVSVINESSLSHRTNTIDAVIVTVFTIATILDIVL